ncbi:hypothetical protein FF38_03003 [Lucilia cuprina]|uniref:Uncharacterized protein n=1 Tax=Lucilia cuprina TaxID=7375 RepID=A0A0L0C0G5_LUCCU|nr:hypothetical protein FF38_03003 [Lucilia cuprina]
MNESDIRPSLSFCYREIVVFSSKNSLIVTKSSRSNSEIDGVHGKLSLKNFIRFYDDLMDSIRANGEVYPEKGIRYAFKVVKKRHFQSIWVSKKKEALFCNNISNIGNYMRVILKPRPMSINHK